MIQKKWFQIPVLMLLCMVFSLLVTGCGGSANNATSAPASPTTEPATTPAGDSYTIEHAMGKTEIKGTPQRVVILTNEGTEALLELGVKPAGAVKSGVGDGWYPHIKSEMDGVTELGDESQPNIELIASLKPDLIIGNKGRHEKIYDQLKSIAPTVFSTDLAGQWKENFKLYAKALNKEEEGKKSMAAYDKHVEEIKTKLGDKANIKVSVVRFLPNAVRIYQKDTFSGVMLKDLGVARPAAQDKDNFMEVVTKERINDLDGDVMFFFNADYDEKKGGTKNQQEWMNDPLFQNLRVAKKNTAFQVNEIIWNTSGGIKAANKMLDEFVTFIEKL
ncbi:iron-siderophore ABC transporter substrate-binding protein [Brevibacillus laterosporus]|uniref:ABC transporter substrate-binding protein n=1 Tax=Brevibacillus laterosporus TaxID=1465 RepID=UPI0018CD195A|nr:iron-siderophore ABC transporter substrate-binding protein [Brevibacillus laterosporus]MBG9798399.1 ABC transporter substrate-binding protein [Brevibacillus laterosporus]MCR8937095.1 iron-siderophore ABC transporter substrate-binding protein [Brevibacillus laterosporus]MCZ0839733.1 iron-siderophore ABC transporter substrate-binding protein [Brevibacillus laterosporus]MCZ0845876.1 iron-siderophore ABC transporter substrate-binding protein [Brevibacillus laterosporus]MED1912847.1 iron-siderop